MEILLQAMSGDQLRQRLSEIETDTKAYIILQRVAEEAIAQLHATEIAIHSEMARQRAVATDINPDNIITFPKTEAGAA